MFVYIYGIYGKGEVNATLLKKIKMRYDEVKKKGEIKYLFG